MRLTQQQHNTSTPTTTPMIILRLLAGGLADPNESDELEEYDGAEGALDIELLELLDEGISKLGEGMGAVGGS